MLEGKHGYLQAFCRNPVPSRLTAELGKTWETRRICIKRYPCHITAHTPVQSQRGLMTEARFRVEDVNEIRVEGAEKLLTHHNITEPADIQKGQYSVPFCVALALYRDPLDPYSFDEGAVADEAIKAACRRVRLVPFDGKPASAWHTRVTVLLNDGRTLVKDSKTFKRKPEDPLDMQDVSEKFLRLSGKRDQNLLDYLVNLESWRLPFPE